jgi:hypothetical protein
MWGNFSSLKDLADKAKAAAEIIDKQLNESVGIETPAKESATVVDMEGLDDAWGDDDDDLLVDETDEQQLSAPFSVPITPIINGQLASENNSGWDRHDDLQIDESLPEDEMRSHTQLDANHERDAEVQGELQLQVADTQEPESSVEVNEQVTMISPVDDSVVPDTEFDLDEDGLVRNDDAVEIQDEPSHVEDTHVVEKESSRQDELVEQEIDRVEVDPAADDSGENAVENVDKAHQDSVTGIKSLSVEESMPVDAVHPESGSAHSEADSVRDRGADDKVCSAQDNESGSKQRSASINAQETGICPASEVDTPVEESDRRDANVPTHASSVAESGSTRQYPSDLETSFVSETTIQVTEMNQDDGVFQELLKQLQRQLQETQIALQRREEQLMNKTEQMTEIEAMHEKEKEELRQKIKDTKEEAKKRIQKAKERVESAETQLSNYKTAQHTSGDDASKQAAIIAELREEGESLARKQSEMEKAVRAAKGEARELKEELERETTAKETALHKVDQLENDLKETKDNLAAARRGESMADKFEDQLRKAKEEDERKSSQILSLEQQLKELKAEARDLLAELEITKKGAAVESQQTIKKLHKDHSDSIAEMEAKINKIEKDAHSREDALRREVDEIRKRWQDAVRRADSLSVDIQSSTAPLLRQLESAERQNRARAAAAAEIETKLRSELEETVMSNEKMSKERADLKTKLSRLERSAKESEDALKSTQQRLDEKISRVKELEKQIEKMEVDMAKKQEQWSEVERLANEGVSRVRSEMTQTVVESEERHRSQLDSIQKELAQEREKRRQLEQQVSGLLENASMFAPTSDEQAVQRDAKPKKLKKSEGQAEILAGALGGLSGSGDESDDNDDDDNDEHDMAQHMLGSNSTNSFAALEEMQSRMKATRVEIEGLRKSLAASEKAKELLVMELRDNRTAKEKLPLFEARCQELTEENRRLDMEVRVLNEEMEDMRMMYRSQMETYIMMSGATGEQASPDDFVQVPEPTAFENS